MPASSYKTLLILAAALLAACTSLTDQAKGFAREHGMRSDAIAGEPFTHQTFYKTGKTVDRLHIYIEGDGRPWLRGHLIADDPTPKTPLALELMARSPYTSLYLGRPCYFGYAKQPPCEPRYWTSARDSEAVVNSLAIAIQQIREPNQKLLLIGYSGGGTLAMTIRRSDGRVNFGGGTSFSNTVRVDGSSITSPRERPEQVEPSSGAIRKSGPATALAGRQSASASLDGNPEPPSRQPADRQNLQRAPTSRAARSS